jgi:glucokinase
VIPKREGKDHLSPRRSIRRGGIDLGGTKIQAVVVDGRWNVIGSSRRPTPTEGGPRDVAEQMSDAMRDAALDAGLRASALTGVGVGSPGTVNEATGSVSQARNLPGWDGTFKLGPWLAKALGSPVSLGNDVRVATDAEARLGAGRRYKSMLGVFWGTGVGGGVILNGEPWLGRGAAGEIGHMVVKRNGARCTCGRKGCMEAYAGRAAMEIKARREKARGAKTDLFKLMKKHDRDRLTSGIWERALKAKDPLAEKLIDRAVKALGAGVASAVNLLDVEAVIIGGGLGCRLGEPYVKRIREAMAPHLFIDEHPPALHVAALGDFGGAIGAALLSANRAKATRAKARSRRTRSTPKAVSGSDGASNAADGPAREPRF